MQKNRPRLSRGRFLHFRHSARAPRRSTLVMMPVTAAVPTTMPAATTAPAAPDPAVPAAHAAPTVAAAPGVAAPVPAGAMPAAVVPAIGATADDELRRLDQAEINSGSAKARSVHRRRLRRACHCRAGTERRRQNYRQSDFFHGNLVHFRSVFRKPSFEDSSAHINSTVGCTSRE